MSNLGNRDVMAANLSFYVEKSGKTQKELAELVGVAPSAFNAWVTGKKYPRIDKIEKLAKLFGILKSDLIEDREEMQKNNDILTDIVIRLRGDKDFFSLVSVLSHMDTHKINGIREMLSTFSK